MIMPSTMKGLSTRLCALLALGLALSGGSVFSQPQASGPTLAILDMKAGVESRLKANADNVRFSRNVNAATPGIDVTIKPGKEGYPGVNVRPPLNAWNLSVFGHVEARVTNTGAKPILIALRVDNDGDWKKNPWNTESVNLDPGATDTITTMFGYAYGHKRGFALKPDAIVNIMIFAVKSDETQSFRINSLVAGGQPGEKPPLPPDEVRTKPTSGFMFGPGVNLDAGKQVQTHGAQALLVGTDKQPSLRLSYPISVDEQSAVITPAVGRWDLSAFLGVLVSVRNSGKAPCTPRARVDTNGGATAWVSAPAPIAPGADGTIAVPFAASSVYAVGKNGTGNVVTSDAVGGVEIAVDSPTTERLLYVDSVQAVMPRVADLPDWVGRRPPVPGDWVKTLDDEFDGSSIDSSIWNIYGENYYDKVTHWSKDDVIVGGGVVKLRYEKKQGFHNDDPKRPRSEYAAGFLQTYDKWAQRYGYFEARMKLPKAPGLWPAFWMMPDRGDRSTPQGVRQDTANMGMEFDIMEHLTRWGPNRYNISMHYDGYGAMHKAVGSDKIYIQPDKDGFITCGLLWTPGSAIFYCNGKEVLRWEDARVSSVPSCFLFTLPSGGWDNNALEDSLLPDDFVIDYVRVWQRKDLASPADGKRTPP